MENILLKNFKAHKKELQINFQNNAKNLLLYGDNGAGKSSIYEAIKLIFFREKLENNITKKITPEEYDEKLLKCMVGFLNSRLFSYLSFLTFSSIGIEREQIFLNEIKNIPMIINDELVNYVDEMLNNKDIDKKSEHGYFDNFRF